MSIASDVYLCGWRVQSEVPLPELMPWPTTANGPVDVTIRLGTVAPVVIESAPRRRFVVDEDGCCRMDISGVCRLAISNGREMIVDPIVSIGSIQLRNYLFGSGLAVLCHQRGVFPLHGSALRIGGQAVIFSGNSGAGKSTLAAALATRGHMLLSDDVCVLDKTSQGWAIRPAFPRVKLHPQSLQAVFGEQVDAPQDALQGKHHYRFKPVQSFQLSPVTVAAIYFLEQCAEGEPEAIIEVRGVERLTLIKSQIYRRRMGRVLGQLAALNITALQIASTVEVRKLRRRFNLQQMDTTIAMIESAHGSLHPI